MQIFQIKAFQFPYDKYKFPGQHSDERILFITREGKLVLYSKLVFLLFISFISLILGLTLISSLKIVNLNLNWLIPFLLIIEFTIFTFFWWWIYQVYQKTLFIISTKRLTKFIHTTPWSRYQMSLGLDKIVDTGAYQKGWLQIFSHLGYFVARSAAGAIKNFKIVNIAFAEDLHNYVNKLLFVFNEHQEQINQFRPFISFLKGVERDEYVRKNAPEFAKSKS